MSRRTAKPLVAKPFVAWKLASIAALASATAMQSAAVLAQQPTPQRSFTNQQSAATQQRPAAGTQQSQQFATRPMTQQQQQQPAAQQQLNAQQPVQRTASNANVPLSGQANGAAVPPAGNPNGLPVDRAALEQQLAQQLAAQQAALAAKLATMPFEALNAEQQKYLEMVLDVWEKRTAAIQRYQCNFKRWVFDPAQNTGNDAASKAEGVVRFMQPDKGLFRVEKLEFFNGRDDKNAAIYSENERQKFGEYWLCDGEYVHILDRNDKKCLKVQLPPEMRGNNIHLSPLPFLFGVKSKEIQDRYWVRPIAPPAGSQDVWLETYPKRPDDAGNYSRVQIILDKNEVLPKGLIVFMPNFRSEQPHREVYEFVDRDKDWSVLDQLKDKFKEEFIPQTLPKDWEIVVEPYQSPQLANQGLADAPMQGQNPGLTPGQNPNAQAQFQNSQQRPVQGGVPGQQQVPNQGNRTAQPPRSTNSPLGR